MKKLIFPLVAVIGLLPASVHGMVLSQTTYPFDQEEAKKSTMFKDGVSFEEMEQSARKRNSNLPAILLVNEIVDPIFGQNFVGDTVFLAQIKNIWASRTTAQKHNSNAFEWLLLHETGHAQQPQVIPAITATVGVTQGLTAYYWGMHRAKPYRNLLTKLGSKCCAAWAASVILNSTAMKIEERRADNWANNTADAKTLQGGIEYLGECKKTQQDQWTNFKVAAFLPLNAGQYLMNPLHPSIDSRIAKCKKALKSRFGIEA